MRQEEIDAIKFPPKDPAMVAAERIRNTAQGACRCKGCSRVIAQWAEIIKKAYEEYEEIV